jgi:hypothetical protein
MHKKKTISDEIWTKLLSLKQEVVHEPSDKDYNLEMIRMASSMAGHHYTDHDLPPDEYELCFKLLYIVSVQSSTI